MPDTMQPAPLPSVYQLRVVVRGVSPLIWRRLLVPADTTIAGLHAVLQTAFGWTGTHLHRFVVHGREYGTAYPGGPSFRDDPRKVRLGDLGLRTTERFTYHKDFTAGWCHDLRVEQVLGAEPGRALPVCTGGRRAGPPEDCGGVQAFLENTQPHHVLAAAIRAAEILGMLLDDEDVPRFGEYRDELAGLLPLLGVDRFDRRTLKPCPGSAVRGRGEGGMKITVQVVLHADEDTQTVVREVFTPDQGGRCRRTPWACSRPWTR